MINTLWLILQASLLIVAIMLVWLVIYSFFMTIIKQWRRDHAKHD